jgi:predicted DCC family thiol-disulfide oxidoreductase YuxK
VPEPSSNSIILYDGVCGLCNRLVQFLLKRDRRDQLRFASLQSEFAATVLKRHGLDPTDLNTVYLIVNHGKISEQVLARSDAIIKALDSLGGIWRIAPLGKVLPRPLRDMFYKAVAANRYRVFGKSDSCMMPEPRHRQKFIEVE